MPLWPFNSTHQRKVNMKHKNPSNPSPQPEDLNLSSNAGTAQEQAARHNPAPERPTKRKARTKSNRSIRSSGTSSRDASENRWHRIKGRLATKVAQVDKEKLREVALGCGVAAGIVAAAILVLKTVPLSVLILGIFGIAVAIRIWKSLQFLPRPF